MEVKQMKQENFDLKKRFMYQLHYIGLALLMIVMTGAVITTFGGSLLTALQHQWLAAAGFLVIGLGCSKL